MDLRFGQEEVLHGSYPVDERVKLQGKGDGGQDAYTERWMYVEKRDLFKNIHYLITWDKD